MLISIFLLPFPSSALSNMLFPALSLLAVGGLLFLITNMQVTVGIQIGKDKINLSVIFSS